MTRKPSDPDAPLRGEAPDPDEFRDPTPQGTTPNASFHVKEKPGWKQRPAEYPVTKDPSRAK